jgi:lipopolysaccharide biosynthesis glycosyltransferase
MIHIVMATDDNFCQHAGIAILSLIRHNIRNNISFHIFEMNVSSKNIENLKQICTQHEKELLLYPISKELFDKFPNPGDFSYATYIRIVIPQILPLSIKKVLYLDCDVIINGDILALWETDIEKYALAGVEDSSWGGSKIKMENESNPEKYINAGVLLMNLTYWRVNNVQQKLIDYLESPPKTLHMFDQDAINDVLSGNILYIAPTWNCIISFFSLPSRIVKDQRKLLWNLRWHAKIIHFAGSRTVKPWFKESRVPYKSNYIRNLKLSPWKDYKPVYACNTKQESYKLMIKRYARNFIFVFYALFFKIKG